MTNTRRAALTVAAVLAFAVLAAGTTGSSGTSSSGSSPAPATSAAPVEQPHPDEAQLPWLATVTGNCQRYDQAPNEIQKSAIFRENEELVTSQRFDRVRARLSRLSTSHGGDHVELKVEIGRATFATGALGGISRRSPVYQQASTLAEGQCVVVTGSVERSSSVLERSRVCDWDYYFDFEGIGPCP